MKNNIGIKKSRRQKRKHNKRVLKALLFKKLSENRLGFDQLYADLVIQKNANINELSSRSHIVCRLVCASLQLPCLDNKYMRIEESLRIKMYERINSHERFDLSSIKADLKDFYDVIVAHNIKKNREKEEAAITRVFEFDVRDMARNIFGIDKGIY